MNGVPQGLGESQKGVLLPPGLPLQANCHALQLWGVRGGVLLSFSISNILLYFSLRFSWGDRLGDCSLLPLRVLTFSTDQCCSLLSGHTVNWHVPSLQCRFAAFFSVLLIFLLRFLPSLHIMYAPHGRGNLISCGNLNSGCLLG
jgi:hypothetical protein